MSPTFGREMKKQFALEDSDVAFCNHGSYGAVPICVQKHKQELCDKMELSPDRWFRTQVREYYDQALDSVASFLGAESADVVFVPNATQGVCTILDSIPLAPGSDILCTSHTYGAVANAADHKALQSQGRVRTVHVPMEVDSEDSYIGLIEEAVRQHASIQMVIVDHITSPSAMLIPVAAVCAAIRKVRTDILILVDGAHGPGQARFQLPSLGADFYVGNLHKWCFTPKSAAILWTHPKHQSLITPLITSWGYQLSYQEQFYAQGTMDISNYCTARAAIEFYHDIGGLDAVQGYTGPLLDWASKMLAKSLGTKLSCTPESMRAPCMRLIALPGSLTRGRKGSRLEGDQLTVDLVKEGAIGAVTCIDGMYWLRISASVYNVPEDYIKLKEALLRVIRSTAE